MERSGNALTNPATHFIGTTDNRVLNFKVNNVSSGIIDNVSYNAAFGYSSQLNNLSGTHNTSMGYGSLISNSTGNYNTSVGAFSSYNNVAGIRIRPLEHLHFFSIMPMTTQQLGMKH
ncbi:MAG: hypothetical protein IPG38_05340 [Chitinophagaceae bacterium]|nr:hypothetical protein [Chitinophagaceae bacterium]